MGLTSLQVCMDSSDWLQATIPEEGTTSMGLDSTSSSSPITGDEMLACSRPLLERRLRPEPEQSLKCPRCDSTHTKFCYYNNYSLSQPRYFCKSCRRYWTKGGTLRNIPFGGGCRKTHSKKPPKKSDNHHSPSSLLLSHTSLAFPEQLQFASLHAAAYGTTPPAPYFFDMDQKYEALLAGQEGGFGAPMINPPAILESCQRMMMPYDGNNHMGVEMKPILSLDQQINCNSDDGKDSFWFMNGYGC